MPANQSPTDLARRIQQLLEERQRHADALADIDRVLAGVGAALGNGAVARRGGGGRPAGSSPSGTKGSADERRKKRRVGKFSTTGEAAVLSFVKQQKNPTSQEIETHWKGEGRGGPAANTLSKLVKEKKLKREPLGQGIRGSRYSLA